MAKTIRSNSVFPDKGFPLVVVRHQAHGPTGLHSHDFHELVVILAGHGRHLLAGGEYEIAAGDVFVIRGDMAHGYADTDRMALVNILFSPRRLKLPWADLGKVPGYHVLFRIEPSLRGEAGFRGRLRLSMDDLGEAAKTITALEEELSDRRPGYQFVACSHLMRLIAYLSRCYSDTQAPESRSLMGIGKLLSFMEDRFHERLSVGTLTKVAAMSESTLMRKFRKVMGRSPIDYLIRLRISKASEMLQRGDARITDIAFECGFSDSNYFSRQFRNVTGKSPRQYRLSESRQ